MRNKSRTGIPAGNCNAYVSSKQRRCVYSPKPGADRC
ncbi:MAG TPA: hypothetical protein DCX93_03145 [Butyrivibrio sp.]|nr:hypothetical protein [Butyrivibrio sp.]